MGGQEIGSLLPIQALGNFSLKAPCTGRLKWGGAPSCMKMARFSVFSLWENVKLKQVQVNVSSNGALRKKEKAYNTITEQPTANLKVARSLPPPIN
jgi:hypothetical protein